MLKKILLVTTILLLLYSSLTTYKLYNSPDPILDTIIVPGDTVFKEITITKPISYKVVEVVKDTIKIPTDTAELKKTYKDAIAELYGSKYYLDTLKNDSSATVIVSAYIKRNALDSLKMAFKNNRPTALITNVTYENNLKWRAGLFTDLSSISGIVTYDVYKRLTIGGRINPQIKQIEAGVLYNF